MASRASHSGSEFIEPHATLWLGHFTCFHSPDDEFDDMRFEKYSRPSIHFTCLSTFAVASLDKGKGISLLASLPPSSSHSQWAPSI